MSIAYVNIWAFNTLMWFLYFFYFKKMVHCFFYSWAFNLSWRNLSIIQQNFKWWICERFLPPGDTIDGVVELYGAGTLKQKGKRTSENHDSIYCTLRLHSPYCTYILQGHKLCNRACILTTAVNQTALFNHLVIYLILNMVNYDYWQTGHRQSLVTPFLLLFQELT